MSSNVDSIKYISGKLYIVRAKAAILLSELDNELAEDNFLNDLVNPRRRRDYSVKQEPAPILDLNEVLEIERVAWRGEFSGYSFDDSFLTKVLPATIGEAELLIIWERGDFIQGLHVKDGIVTKKKVKFVLED